MPYVCRKCCCKIFSDDFNDNSLHADWTSVAGTWTESSGVLSTSSTSAIITRDTGLATSAMETTVLVRGATDDRLRLIVAFTDADNYWFAQVIIGTSKTLTLVKRSGGSDTTLVSAATTLAADTWYTLRVCVNALGAMSAHISSFVLNGNSQGPEGLGVVGLGTGTTASASTQFDNFTVKKVSDTCQKCAGSCVAHCAASPPPAWDVYLPSSLANDECDKCADWAAAPIRVYWCSGTSSTVGRCLWGRLLEECNTHPVGGTTIRNVRLQVLMEDSLITPGGVDIYVRLQRRNTGASGGWSSGDYCGEGGEEGMNWRKTVATATADCSDTHDCTGGSINSFCDRPASTATIVPVF